MTIISVIGPALDLLSKVFRKKACVLWYRDPRTEKWVQKSDPMSNRQCRKTQAALIGLGTYLPDRFVILRKGVTP